MRAGGWTYAIEAIVHFSQMLPHQDEKGNWIKKKNNNPVHQGSNC